MFTVQDIVDFDKTADAIAATTPPRRRRRATRLTTPQKSIVNNDVTVPTKRKRTETPIQVSDQSSAIETHKRRRRSVGMVAPLAIRAVSDVADGTKKDKSSDLNRVTMDEEKDGKKNERSFMIAKGVKKR